MKKPVFGVCNQLRLKPGCAATETSLSLNIAHKETRDTILSKQQTTKALIRLRQLFREQLDYIRTHHKGKKLASVYVLGNFNFKDTDSPDRLSKSGSTLSQSEGQILIDIVNDHCLEQMVHFPNQEKNTLDLILTTLPCQFQDVHSLTNLVIMTSSQEP